MSILKNILFPNPCFMRKSVSEKELYADEYGVF